MNIKIVKILDAGAANKEKLQLKAVADDNIGNYVVFDTLQIEPGRIASIPKNAYWFPDRNVKGNDIIFLYTGPGKNYETKNEDGTTTWYFYWGRNVTLWKNKNSSAALLRIHDWEYRTVS